MFLMWGVIGNVLGVEFGILHPHPNPFSLIWALIDSYFDPFTAQNSDSKNMVIVYDF